VTDLSGGAAGAGSEGMRLLLKRAGHELRNAQNAAAVNLEVVRSRVSAGRTGREDLQSFADNAAQGLEESARLGEQLVALCSAAAAAMTAGAFRESADGSGTISMELGMATDAASLLAERLITLASRAGFAAEAAAGGIILRVPPDSERNRA